MFKAKEFFEKTIKNLPSWTDTQKRPEYSISGKYFKSISTEQDEIEKFFEEYKKEFFLINYIGKEDSILYKANFANIGNIDEEIIFKNCNLEITTDYKKFVLNTDKYTLYQEGFLIFNPKVFDKDFIVYSVDGFEYSEPIFEDRIWNIFDEFAMFSSLERFKDETNKELLNRCLAVFKNPTNSTLDGIRNAIINTLVNKTTLVPSDITINNAFDDNLLSYSDGEEIYEHLTHFNKDLLRSKVFDKSKWEHHFKKTGLIPHKWDKKLKEYQIGTGQGDNLKVSLMSEIDSETGTDVYITGYKKSVSLINSYIRREGIKKDISLELQRYTNEIKPQKVQYKITANDLEKLDTDNIFLTGYRSISGYNNYPLDELLLDAKNLSKVDNSIIYDRTSNNILPSGYQVHIRSKNDYLPIEINKLDCIVDNVTTNLINNRNLVERFTRNNNINLTRNNVGLFTIEDNKIKDTIATKYVNKVIDLKDYSNIAELSTGGFTINNESSVGEMEIDVSNISNKLVIIKRNCKLIDYSSEPTFVNQNGFTLVNSSTYVSSDNSNNHTMIIDIDCVDFSMEFISSIVENEHGSISVKFEVDGEVNNTYSGIWTEDRLVNISFNDLKRVHIEITQIGMYPVKIMNIKASRYKIKTWLDNGEMREDGGDLILPENNTKNSLHILVQSLSGYAPTIDFIYIGNRPQKREIVLEINNTKRNANKIKLDLKQNSNCVVDLYKIINGRCELIRNDILTTNEYHNNTNNNIIVPIDLSNFSDIISSNKIITKGVNEGRLIDTITIAPNERINSIMIDGIYSKKIYHNSLSTILNKRVNDNIYISNNIKGFLITNNNVDFKIVNIRKSELPSEIDLLKYTGTNEKHLIQFIISTDKNIISNKDFIDKQFEYTYISLNSTKNYVAYNEVVMIEDSITTNIVNLFNPILDMNKLMIYTLSNIKPENHIEGLTCNFIVNNKLTTQCISNSNVSIKVKFPLEENIANLCNKKTELQNEKYLLSNTIDLNPYYIVNGNKEYLSKYIIKPPQGTSIRYIQDSMNEIIVPESDGFNKLAFSNINRILWVKDLASNVEINSNLYSLINKYGLIVWKDKNLIGKRLQVFYSYNIPSQLVFEDLNILYEQIEFSTDAYKVINKVPLKFNNVKENESINFSFGGDIAPDKVIAKCSNSNYKCIINGNSFVVNKVQNNNGIVLHDGYYYDEDKEYFLFSSQYKDSFSKQKNIKYHNIVQHNNKLRTVEETNNMLLNSSFKDRKDVLKPICIIDAKKHKSRISTNNYLNNISSCETVDSWYLYNMNISLGDGYNGPGLSFTSINNNAYAMLDITEYVKNGRLLSLYKNGNIDIYISKEILINDMSLKKSIFTEIIDTVSRHRNTNFYYHKFSNIEKDCRYYIVVKGNGNIDDILITNNKISEIEDIHIKNIDKTEFKIEEPTFKNQIIPLSFDNTFSKYYGIERYNDNVLSLGSTIDYGLTMLFNLTDDFNLFARYKCDLINDTFVSSSNEGKITSYPIMLNNISTLKSLFIKVNNVISDNEKYMNIKVMTAKNYDDNYTYVKHKRKTNLLEVNASDLSKYIIIEIEVAENKIVNNLEVYGLYVEKEKYKPRATIVNNGYLVSKVYDLINIDNYKVHGINMDIISSNSNLNNIIIYARGCRTNNRDVVWTKWYPLAFSVNENGLYLINEDSHVFNEYRYLQFKVHLNENTKVKINEIMIKVV